MKSRLLALFFTAGLVGCAVPVYSALAYDDDLPAVENRNMLSDEPVIKSAPASGSVSVSDKPMLLLEEENGSVQPAATLPDTPAARIEQLQQQVQELQGKLEIQEHRFQELTKQTLDNYQDLDLRIKNLVAIQAEQAAKVPVSIAEPGKDNPATAVSTGPEPKAVAVPEDDRVLYHKAYSLAQSKQYDASIEAFKFLIKTDPKSTYVPTAYFWMGEIYIIQSKYDEAVESFNQIVSHYSSSPKVSEAKFKIGYIAYARGNNKQAIKNFNDVKNKYPGTAAAKQADQYLKKLKTKK
jgi:tol-pal system protein YbgF